MATHRGIHWGSQQDLTNGAILADQCKRFIDGKAPLKNPQMGHAVTTYWLASRLHGHFSQGWIMGIHDYLPNS